MKIAKQNIAAYSILEYQKAEIILTWNPQSSEAEKEVY